MTEITKIIPPKSGKVTEIIHIADIHIRNGDEIASRYDEYYKVFSNLFMTLKKLNSVKNNEAVCVICGDTFHAKTKLETPGIKLFLYLLQNLGSILPTFIILGNHDFKQDQMDNSIDFLDAFGHVISDNIVFLQETGLYTCANLGIGLVDIKETLRIGSGSGMAERLPNFPDPSEFPEEINKTIALFHGTMVHSKFTDNRTTNEGYPWEWIDVGYNYALLGDIHKQQIFPRRKKTNMMAAYSGSLIQQNYGETLFKHGILIWNLEEDSVKSIDIKNEYGFLKLMNKNNTWLLEKYPLIDSVKSPNFPENLRIRIFGSYSDEQKYVLKDLLNNCEYTLDETVIKDDITQTNSSDFSSEGLLEQYMLENNISDYSVPELDELLIKNESEFNDELKKIIKKKNSDLEKEYSIYSKTLEISDKITKFNIKYLEWAGLLCYSEKNWIDFDLMKNKTNLISAPNGGGKSSYLEIICISIYGKPIPSRTTKGNPIALISKGKSEKDPSYTVVHIEIDESIYRINRIFDKDGKPKTRGGGVFKVNGDEWITICVDPPKIKEWVLKNIGDINEFLMTTLVSQSNDSDFLSMKPIEQRLHLEKLLGMRAANSKANLFKQAFSIIKSFKTNLDVSFEYNDDKNTQKDELGAIIAIYNVKKDMLDSMTSSLRKSWGICKVEDLDLDICEIISKRDSYRNIEQDLISENTILQNLNVIQSKLEPPCKKPSKSYDYLEKKSHEIVEKINYTNKPLFKEDDINKIELEFNKEIEYQTISIEEYEESLKIIDRLSYKLDKYSKEKEEIHQEKITLENKDDDLSEKYALIRKNIISMPNVDKETIKVLLDDVKRDKDLYDENKALLAIYCAQKVIWGEHIEKVELNKGEYSNICNSIEETRYSLKDIPFNSNCNACKSQPLRMQLHNLYSRSQKLIEESIILEEKTKDLVEISSEECDELRIWINNFENKSKLFSDYIQLLEKWKQFEEYDDSLKNIDTERDELRQKIKNIRLRQKRFNVQENLIKEDLNSCRELCRKFEYIQTKSKYLDERKAFVVAIKTQWYLYKKYQRYEEYNEIHKEFEQLKQYMVYENKLESIQNRICEVINNIDNYKKILKNYDYWTEIRANKDDYDKQTNKNLEIQILREEIQDLYGRKEVLLHSINEKNIVNEKNIHLKEISDNIGKKMDKLFELGKLFDQYRAWLYEKHILPKLVMRANKFVSNVELYLSLCYSIKEDGTFIFTVKNEKHEVSLEKASGFEYFILAISIRLAFITLTMGDNLGGQFFIDEGFTACDSRHLNKIPNFLQCLLEMFNSIILVSHIEHIKDSVDNTIFIRNRSIQHGSTYSFKKPKIVRKKRVNS